MLPGVGDHKRVHKNTSPGPHPLSRLIANTEHDLALGPKRHWSSQQKVVADREIHYKLIVNAKSIIGRERKRFEEKMKIQRKLFDTSEAKAKAQRFKEQEIVKENKRMLRRLLKIEMAETEITRTNSKGVERQKDLMRKRARKRAVRASKQFELDRLNRENKVMLRRINNARGAFNKSDWKKDFKKHEKRKKFMSKMGRRKKPSNRGGYRSLPALNVGKHNKGSLPESGIEISNDSDFLATLWNAKQSRKEQPSLEQSRSASGLHLPSVRNNNNHSEEMDGAKAVQEQLQMIQMMKGAGGSMGLPGEGQPPMSAADLIPKRRPNYEGMSAAELNIAISQMALELSPSISMSAFKAMVAEMPRRVLVKTLIDVWTAKNDSSKLLEERRRLMQEGNGGNSFRSISGTQNSQHRSGFLKSTGPSIDAERRTRKSKRRRRKKKEHNKRLID